MTQVFRGSGIDPSAVDLGDFALQVFNGDGQAAVEVLASCVSVNAYGCELFTDGFALDSAAAWDA